MTDPLTSVATTGAPNLAVDVQPDLVPGTFTVGVSEVGGPDQLGWSATGAGDWVGIVCDVTALSTSRGALQEQGELTRTEAGTATIRIRDMLRRFDPLNNSDSIHKGTPLRVRAWGYRDGGLGPRWDAVLWTGQLDAPAVEYTATGALNVTLTALDLAGQLAAWESEGRDNPGVGAGDNLRGRVNRALAEVGRGVVSSDSDQLYEVTLAPTTLARPWQAVQDAARAEQGRVWVNAAGELVVRARDSELSGTVRGTLSDKHGEAPLGVHCCYAGGTPNYRPAAIVNRVLASRRVPSDPAVTSPPPAVLSRVDDAYSQARYGTATLDARSLELQTDEQASRWAQAVVLNSAAPVVQVDQVQPAPWGNPYTAPADPNAWEAVCLTDVGDRWLYRLHPEVGDPVTRALGILGVEHEVTPDGWSITWQTIDAPEPGVANPSGYFTVGLSEVGGNDVLSLFGGQPPGDLFGDVDGGGAVQGMITRVVDGGTATSEQYEAPVDGGGARP